jgi:chromosome segregation ATPase
MENAVDKLLNECYEALEKLRNEVTQLETIRLSIEELKTDNEQLPILFQKKFNEIIKLSENYSNALGAATKKYLDGNNRLFTEKLKELSSKAGELKTEISRLAGTDFNKLFNGLQKTFIEQTRKDVEVELRKIDGKTQELQTKINNLQTEISRLVNTDFDNLFKELQKTFIDQTREDVNDELQKIDGKTQELQTKINDLQTEISRLVDTDFHRLFRELQETFIEQTREDVSVELQRFTDKANDFQAKIDELKQQVVRLEGIDLEAHFSRHQRTLSEIFNAINSVNLTLSGITQTLTSITQSLGTIQNTIEVQHREIKQDIKNFSDITKHHLDSQDNMTAGNQGIIENLLAQQQQQLEALAKQNAYLRKEITTNRTIQIIIGSALFLLFIIFSLTK